MLCGATALQNFAKFLEMHMVDSDITAQKRSFPSMISLHLLKKSLIENFIFCAVNINPIGSLEINQNSRILF